MQDVLGPKGDTLEPPPRLPDGLRPVPRDKHKGNNCEIASRDIFFVSDSEMTDCVDGAETLGGPDLVTGLAPGLRMEDMALAEKLDRTLLSNTG